MFLLKEVDNKNVLFVLRSFLGLLYLSIGIEFIRVNSYDLYTLDKLHGMGFFLLFAALFTIFPLSRKFFKIKNKKIVDDVSIGLAAAILLLMHVYLFIGSRGVANLHYVFLSLSMCLFTQIPLAYISEKIYNHEK